MIEKESQIGIKIIRPDFIILKYGICIEIDGGIHDRLDQKVLQDRLKVELFHGHGIYIHRFNNSDIDMVENSGPSGVNRCVDQILSHIKFIEQSGKDKQIRNKVKKSIKVAQLKAQSESIDRGISKLKKPKAKITRGNDRCIKFVQHGGFVYRLNN